MQQISKLNMLVVCLDEEYLKSIEYKLAYALCDKVNISYISDYECLKNYNTQPKDIDILLIEEKLYKEVVMKQNCKRVYILTDNENISEKTDENKNHTILYKYSSIRVIIDKIDSRLLGSTYNTNHTKCKVISIYSPIGGCGKTTVAIGLAKQLGSKGYKVLYVSTEALQDYQKVLGETEYLPDQVGYQVNIQPLKAAEEMLKYVKKDEFEYFPAWKRMLPSYGINTEKLLKIIAYIQEKNIYDYIVTELSCEVQEEKMNFIYNSNGIVLVTKQDKESVEKLKCFLDSIVEWKSVGLILCNFYNENNMNFLHENQRKLKYPICEYIEKYEDEKFLCQSKLRAISDLHLLEKTAMAIL